jgi:hypothetical protein
MKSRPNSGVSQIRKLLWEEINLEVQSTVSEKKRENS